MSSSREQSQTTKPNGSIPRDGRLLSLIFALSRNPNRLPPRTHTFFEMLEKATAREITLNLTIPAAFVETLELPKQGGNWVESKFLTFAIARARAVPRVLLVMNQQLTVTREDNSSCIELDCLNQSSLHNRS